MGNTTNTTGAGQLVPQGPRSTASQARPVQGQGQVNSVQAGTGLEVSGSGSSNPTLSLADIDAGQVLARAAAGSGSPEGTDLSTLLDFVFGDAHGNVLFRGASVWEALSPGIAAYVLTSGGPGADPSWTASGGGGGGGGNLLGTTEIVLHTDTSGGGFFTTTNWTAVEDPLAAYTSGSDHVVTPTGATFVRVYMETGWTPSTGASRYVGVFGDTNFNPSSPLYVADLRNGLGESISSIVGTPREVVAGDPLYPGYNGGTITSTSGTDFGRPTTVVFEWYSGYPGGTGGGGGGGIPDAPSDGQLYGREDAAWVVVPTSGAIDSLDKDMTAASALSGHRVVMADSTGKATYPDTTVLADGLAVVGITNSAASSGTPISVRLFGVMDEGTWAWTPGEPIYCDNNGVLTQTLPSDKWLLQVATALSATRINVELRTLLSTP